MSPRYNDTERKTCLGMIKNVKDNWEGVLDSDTKFYAAIYWDLLMNLWRQNSPITISEALQSMRSVQSPVTARKHLNVAKKKGWIYEVDHPTDTRSRLVAISPDFKQRLDAFLDAEVSALAHTNRTISQADSRSKRTV